MKTITVFGATGRTGVHFVRKALQDYRIKALVRSPGKMQIKHPGLVVIQGDVMNKEDVEKTISGSDAVVNLIGHGNGSPPDLQTVAISHIIAAMKKEGISRIITLTGGGAKDPQNDNPGLIDKAIVFAMKYIAGKTPRNALRDGREFAVVLRNSDLDWTIVRAPVLTNEPAKENIEVGHVGTVSGFKLTRENAAEFILKILKENSFIKNMPFITNG